ncbi:MAG: TonB-dependent receptor [Pseudomonadota bacterium]
MSIKVFNRYSAVSVAALTIVAPMSALAVEPVDEDEIVVTASPLARTQQETIIGTSVVDGEELERRLENSIGEVLRREPGVSSTFFGPGASRPIIRGLGGDRIRVLDAGIGSIDASATSPDHAVAVDTATTERIEIVRGTSMLLYGSSAAGGVVNVFNGRIPTAAPEDGIDGALRIGGSTVDNGVEAAGSFDVKLLDTGDGAIVFHGDGFYRDTEDYDIPGFAESEILRALEAADADPDADDDEEEVFGTVENSAFETVGGSAGLSYVFANGFFGVSATAIDTFYGVPGGHEEGEEGGDDEEEEEGGVSIDLSQRRLDLNGEIESDFLLFQKAKIRVGYADYEHTELEPSGEAGTVFANEGWEGRIELVDKTRSIGGAELNGALGFQYRNRDFSAIGEEAFVPPTTTDQFGVFVLKELSTGPFRFELGGRYENTSHTVSETGFEREFNGFSVSGGVGYEPAEGVFLGATVSRTERAPSIEELFSNGPHLATGAFELGDPNFDEERAIGVEATFRYATERYSFSVNGFYTSYDDFIYEAITDEIEDGLPVFQFLADDATFRGFEALAEAELFEAGGFDIHTDASVDFVRATIDVTGNDNLPRIPPFSGLFGVEARSNSLDLRAEVEYAAEQDDVTEFELPTDGYTLVNAFVTFRPFPETTGLSLQLAARNLNNADARLHTSFLKDVAPLPGRNIRISLRGEF